MHTLDAMACAVQYERSIRSSVLWCEKQFMHNFQLWCSWQELLGKLPHVGVATASMRQMPFCFWALDLTSNGQSCYGRLQHCERVLQGQANRTIVCLFLHFAICEGRLNLSAHLFLISALQLLTWECAVISIMSNVIKFGCVAALL